jgi:hypothetical protein
MLLKINEKKTEYKCCLCRTEATTLINIMINPINYTKTFKISNTEIPIEIITDKTLFTKFIDKLIPKINKDTFISMIGTALTPT